MAWLKRKRHVPDPREQAALLLEMERVGEPVDLTPRHHILREVEPTDVLDAQGNVVRRGVCVECSCGHVFTHPVDAVAHRRWAIQAEAKLQRLLED